MKRKCHWCGEQYDTDKESSVWCFDNPHRGRGAGRLPKKVFSMLMLPAKQTQQKAKR